jgi:hypothetical protein
MFEKIHSQAPQHARESYKDADVLAWYHTVEKFMQDSAEDPQSVSFLLFCHQSFGRLLIRLKMQSWTCRRQLPIFQA